MKIDTQGTELEVLQGAGQVLQRTMGCLVEHIFASPYRRSYRFEDLVEWFSQREFACVGPLSVSRRRQHQISAVDFLFVKSTRGSSQAL
jgi:hypothetical protein